MHNQVKHKVKLQNKRQGHWLDAPGLALILSNYWYPRNLTLVDLLTPVGPAPLGFPSSAPRDLSYMQKMTTIKIVQCMRCKVHYDA
jgi:hypothetical protein